jgi:hypothetical protein
MTVNGIKAENTELRQEVARLDEAIAIEVRRSANLASEKADDRVQYSKLRDVCRAQEEAITRLTSENEKLKAGLRECEAELNAYYRMEYPGSHPYSQKELAKAMASNPATVALKETSNDQA